MAATEIVRRCERRIGQLVREGQERGDILSTGQNRIHAGRAVAVNNSPSPTTAAGVKHRSEVAEMYAMTDGVSDEQFEGSGNAA